jgi:ABC-type phosphate/phosphonate transport system substrate-binding protein
LLLDLADRPEGRHVLDSLGVDRFVTIEDTAYDAVRETAREAGVAP